MSGTRHIIVTFDQSDWDVFRSRHGDAALADIHRLITDYSNSCIRNVDATAEAVRLIYALAADDRADVSLFEEQASECKAWD